jgi:hypothetical protein
MYSLMMTTDQHAPVAIFFVINVLIGAFFIVNICLAVISDCYNAASSAANAKVPELLREKLKQKLMQMGLISSTTVQVRACAHESARACGVGAPLSRVTIQALFAEGLRTSVGESEARQLGHHRYAHKHVRARACVCTCVCKHAHGCTQVHAEGHADKVYGHHA